jgi:hypothetical protein
MLIKITNRCGAGCNHCLENSTPAGEHMTEETFRKALAFTRRAEAKAWAMSCPRHVLLSGGECTEHPDIVRYVEMVFAAGLLPILISNGHWLGNEELRTALLRPEWNLFVQVTYDSRFYPTAPPRFDDPRITYVESLSVFIPLGRGAKKKTAGLPMLKGPSSFNLRSMARGLRSFDGAVSMLRMRATAGLAGHCIPSVTHEGFVVAGESRECWRIGTVDSTNDELTAALLAMGECNRCGLEAGLTMEQKRAIGVTTLYGPNE